MSLHRESIGERGIVIRECRGFEELQACVDLQIEVWGYSDGDVIPRRAFLVAQKIGGQAIGAFEVRDQGSGVRDHEGLDQGSAESLVGFAFSLPGVKSIDGRAESYLHSHMLAVKEGYRNRNIGARLKLAQREEALGRGIRRIEWTFDPLEIKNAFLNIRKLGAIARRYEENFYGASSSRLQGGLQTDRLVAEWWLDSARVEAALGGHASASPGSGVLDSLAEDSVTSIRVPADVYAWKADDGQRHRARLVQEENRLAFQEAFARGLAVVDFQCDAQGNGTYFLSGFLSGAGAAV